jgi:hypothetical protein
MSSPMVCGEAALIRAHWPGWNWSQTFDRIVDYVDDMPNEPLWVQGKMGSGRINVYKALSGDDPIILTYFTAEEMDGDVLLKWDVDWMENVDGFNIYRKELNDTKTEMEKSLFENNSARIKINEQMITGSPPYSFLDRELEEGSYRYYLVAVENQSEDEISEASVDVNGMPMSFRISSIYPNPLVDNGTVMLTLSESTDVCIEIYDISGRLVHKIYDGYIEEGEHSVDINLTNFSNGLYILKASDENSVDQKKFVVVR